MTTSPNASAPDVQSLQTALETIVSPWVRDLGLKVQRARPGEVEVVLPVTPRLVHVGGVLCGQSILAAADTAMVVAIMSRLGAFKPMTTVQLQTSFIRPVSPECAEVRLTARVLRQGRNLVFGEVHFWAPTETLAAHATTTYALLS